MKAEIRVTDDGFYELGGKVDGVFVPFVSQPGTAVDGIVAAGKAAESAAAGAPAEETSQHA